MFFIGRLSTIFDLSRSIRRQYKFVNKSTALTISIVKYDLKTKTVVT